MAYSKNILPKASAYYTLNQALMTGTELFIDSSGYAEINISQQMLPKLTSKMLVVAHPSVFSDYYTNDNIQINLSIITAEGERIEILIPVSEHPSGVFNTEISLPEVEYVMFTFRISSTVPVTLYNWELCAEEAADMTTIIEGVEQELPKLLYDYNTYSYAIGQKELIVGLISCFLHADTDLQGHFTLSFFATERCNVHVRIKDNGVTELFSPQVYTVERGYASISIPHAYLKKKATDHAFAVSVQCTNGQLSIPVRGLLYTIDGGYLATRLLDAGIDVQDISIKQTKNDLTPSEIWAIGFESTRLILKRRVYSQLQRANWEAIKDFGEGIAAGVEFNGQWLSRDNAKAYTIETEESPFVFILDLEHNLINYQGDDFTTEYLLDNNVDSFHVCRGFNSQYDIKQDQGIVATYIKSGNVYYTQWLYDQSNESWHWYPVETLYEEGDAEFVSIHRLPDYRIGICITHSSGTTWYITDRTWVGQAVKPEMDTANISTFIVASVLDVNKAEDTIGLSAVLNTLEEQEEYTDFSMTFNGTLVFLDGKSMYDLRQDIVVTVDGKALLKDAFEIIINGGTMTIVLKPGIRGGRKVTVVYNAPYLFIRAYNNSYAYIKQSYSWQPPAPTMYHNETDTLNVEGSLNLKVSPLVTTIKEVVETNETNISAPLNLQVKALRYPNVIIDDEIINSNVDATLNLIVTLVGTTPV